MINIFSNFFLKKDNKVIGPLRLEEIEEFMYDNFLNGTELVSENDTENWISIKKVLPDFDLIIAGFESQNKEKIFLSQINKDSKFKILTEHNLKMGPVNVKSLLQMIDGNKILSKYKIILDNLVIPYSSISQRLYDVLSKAVDEFKNEEIYIDMDMDMDMDMDEPITKSQSTNNSKLINIEKKDNFEKKEKNMDKKDEFDNIKSIDLSSLNIESMKADNLHFKEKTLSVENEKGLLSSKPLISLFFIYALEKLTGVLIIDKKSDKYEIFFEKGKIASVITNNTDFSIVSFLESKNIFISNELEDSDSVVISKLIVSGKLEPAKGYELLKELTFFRLKEIFKFSNGRFVFKRNQKNDLNLDINFINNIWSIYIKLINCDTINKFIDKIMDNIILKTELFNRKNLISLAPLELKLINKINDKLTIRDFLNALEKQKPEYVKRFKKVIYLFFNITFVKPGNLKDLRNIEQEIKKYKKRLLYIEGDVNLFDVLDLSRNATLKEVHSKYLFYAKEFHPDKLNKEPNKQLRQLKSNIYTSISTAFNKLSTQQKLDDYKESLNYSKVDTELYFKAEDIFVESRKALKVGKYQKAYDLIQEAINLVDNEEYRIHEKYINFILVWRTNKVAANKYLNELSKLVEKLPNYVEGYRFLARIHKLLKNNTEAQLNWRKILKLAPYDSEAKREL